MGPSRPVGRLAGFVRSLAAAFLLLGACILPARSEPPEPVELQLEVLINGQPSGFVAAFTRDVEGRFFARAGELREVGIRPPAGATDDRVVGLADLPGLTRTYDEAGQRLDIATGDANRVV